MEKLLLTAKDAAVMMSCSRSTIYEMVASNQLPSVRIGMGRRGVRLPVSALRTWIEERQVAPGTEKPDEIT